MNTQELIKKNLIVKMLAGSHAYGTNTPTSDVDYRGIFVAPPECIRTPFFPVTEVEDTTEEDSKYYEASKFLKLYTDGNPNIVELLWTDETDVVISSPAYRLLRSVREDLLSSKVAFTFSGYAVSQLKRIKGHNKWLTNPQGELPPRQIDFISLVQWFGPDKRFKLNLEFFYEGYRLIPYGGDTFGLIVADGFHAFNKDSFNLNTLFEGDHHSVGTPLAIVKFNKEEYNLTKDKWAQYWTWKKNRNETRHELEENFGFDTKHAMHLVRLLRVGKEILETGQVLVKRLDAEELLQIRNGAWTYDEILKYAEEMDHEVREVWYKKTSLPKYPDLKKAAKILMEVQDIVWSI